MQAKDFRINQLIEISVDEEGTDYKFMASRIEEVTAEHLHVAVPMRKGELLPLRVRQHLNINMFFKGKSFVFKTVIVARHLDPFPVLVVVKPDKFVEIQRRQWVRVPTKLAMRFRAISSGKNEKPYVGETVDISGGGLLFVTLDPVEEGQMVELEIALPGPTPLFCKAKLLRILEKPKKEGATSKVILEFTEISEGQRDRIISYIFEKQREWIRKGLI
ncbi:MAG: flagellar brake domain-containing protein [Syntrophomonas sp.]|nr:flagellar brake domain-containing protein [Syntrophomonas sp.]